MSPIGPQPGTATNIQCRCGAWMRLGYRPIRRDWPERDAFIARHTGEGHGLTRDEYRAPCRPPGGCRNCGAPPAWPKRFYCSDTCRVEFEADHFWGTARPRAWYRQGVWDIETHDHVGTVCARCGRTGRGALEVNHIRPVNGMRYDFGCQHHHAGLEALCHECHVEVTAEQRAAGLIGVASIDR